MFTGIVQSQAQVITINSGENFISLRVCLKNEHAVSLAKGASVANNGVCLTVVGFCKDNDNQTLIDFDVIEETLRVTNLSLAEVGSWLNIERSLKAGDEIGGHLVSGHIHTMAQLITRDETQDNCTMKFYCDQAWMKYIMPKGFITINGISLTVGEVADSSFTVHLIPETLARTNLGQLAQGANVNIECDQQTMTIVNTIERMKLSLTAQD